MLQYFHDAYQPALAAFLAATEAAGFSVTKLAHGTQGPDGSELFIHIAHKGAAQPKRALVVSSGTHGVEGYFGSAVQLSLLADTLRTWELDDDQAIVLIYGVNPWGFAHKRRVDHEGIDLNRNFRKPGEAFEGAPEGYTRMEKMLNPDTPPGGLDLWLLSAGIQVAKYGFNSLKDAVASGQYDYSHGLFFGGKGPSTTQKLLREALPPMLGAAERVVHIDLHTGSGPWGTYVCTVDMPSDHPRVERWRQEQGADKMEVLDPSGVLYNIRGALGPWLQTLMPEVEYDCTLAEFGTYHNLRVLAGLRYENRIVRHASDDPKMREKGKAEMLEMFCPADPTWRTTSVEMARGIVDKALKAIF